jgi:hypothetical protein
MSATAWPTGVTARFLTLGGATVDVTDKTARCTGCAWHDTPAASEAGANREAQNHAERCRAMARPEVTA